jgi:carbonic anhydrase
VIKGSGEEPMSTSIMQKLLEGTRHFQREVFPGKKQLFSNLASQQAPEILFITCADSRIVPDLITQTSPGELFICRNAGNIIPPNGEESGGVSATIEYAVAVLKVRNVIVCGHSDCGAMKGLMHPEKLQGLPKVSAWLKHSDSAHRMVVENHSCDTEEETLLRLTEENVLCQLEHLKSHPSVAVAVARGDLDLYGWVYDIVSGTITSYDANLAKFVPLRNSVPSATPKPRFGRRQANFAKGSSLVQSHG